MSSPEEQWRPVVGFEGLYEVSDMGRVRSLDRTISVLGRWGKTEHRRYKGRVLKPHVSGTGGYLCVIVSLNSVKTTRTIHSLVLEAFVGPRPPDQESRHKNCQSHDNRLDNLCYGTRGQNREDSRQNGTLALGERIAQHKLTAEDIRKIRKAAGRHEDIAEIFGVSRRQISRIKRGENWQHV